MADIVSAVAAVADASGDGVGTAVATDGAATTFAVAVDADVSTANVAPQRRWRTTGEVRR